MMAAWEQLPFAHHSLFQVYGISNYMQGSTSYFVRAMRKKNLCIKNTKDHCAK